MDRLEASRKQHELAHLWSSGALFHNVHRRHAVTPTGPVDRLISILQRGLLAPAHDTENRAVVSDLAIHISSPGHDYANAIFLHKYDPGVSPVYVPRFTDDTFTVFVDEQVPTMSHKDLGYAWPCLSQDEVFSFEPVPPEKFTALLAPKAYLGEIAVQEALLSHSFPAYGI